MISHFVMERHISVYVRFECWLELLTIIPAVLVLDFFCFCFCFLSMCSDWSIVKILHVQQHHWSENLTKDSHVSEFSLFFSHFWLISQYSVFNIRTSDALKEPTSVSSCPKIWDLQFSTFAQTLNPVLWTKLFPVSCFDFLFFFCLCRQVGLESPAASSATHLHVHLQSLPSSYFCCSSQPHTARLYCQPSCLYSWGKKQFVRKVTLTQSNTEIMCSQQTARLPKTNTVYIYPVKHTLQILFTLFSKSFLT